MDFPFKETVPKEQLSGLRNVVFSAAGFLSHGFHKVCGLEDLLHRPYQSLMEDVLLNVVTGQQKQQQSA